jgi:putative phage-type endonuclease
MENEEFLKKRLDGIGGSEAAIILGISPFKSRLELYHEKVNRQINIDESLNLLFNIGYALEPVIAYHYSRKTNRLLEKRPQKLHPQYPFITGNIDREIVKSERETSGILEIKTKGDFVNWYEEEIPPYYITQMMQYLAVYNYSWGSFAVLDLGKREINVTDIERDNNLINLIIEEEKKFWNLVQTKTPPTIEPTIACNSFLKEIYKTSEPITIDISDNKEAFEWAVKLKIIKQQTKDLEKEELKYKNYFMDLLKNAEKAIGNGYIITWKNDSDSLKFDIDNFKLENQELYKKYLKEKKGVRRFLSKFDKE